MPSSTDETPLPKTFREYIRSFGPGLIVVLTWLGAGDIVGSGTAGGNYGYDLMWILVLALVMRFFFVSLIAKYQLCNQHGESVLDGLARLHPWYAPFLMIVAIVMGHLYGSYMARGIGETWANLTGWGETWQWAVLWSGLALALVFRPVYRHVELVFKVLLALLAASLLGVAIWVGPDFAGMARGTVTFSLPQQQGPFASLLIAMSMIGAVGGSVMNLAYPYFLEQKGWRGPQFRRVQTYDFVLAVIVMIVLNLAIWTLGAEVLHPRGAKIADLKDLALLLGKDLGRGGAVLFYMGVFAAIFTSLVGHALGLASMASHGYLRWRSGEGRLQIDYRNHPLYRCVVVWILISPLIYTMPGMPKFVTLTLIVNSLQVVLIPPLAIGLWWITARAKHIGEEFRNRWWENLVMAVVLVISLWAMYGSIKSVGDKLRELIDGKPVQILQCTRETATIASCTSRASTVKQSNVLAVSDSARERSRNKCLISRHALASGSSRNRGLAPCG